MWSKLWSFLGKAFSENGEPSSSRITSAWLSVASMSLIWYIAMRAIYLPMDKLQVLMANMPLLIAALGTFSTAPYGISKITGIWNKTATKVVDEQVKP